MCCTSRIGRGKVSGSAPITLASAGGPPVEAAMPKTLGDWPGTTGMGDGAAAGAVRPAHSAPIGRRRITGTWAMMRNCVQISPATAS